MSIEANITSADGWFAGEDKQFVFTVQNAQAGVQNITGWTLQFKLTATQGQAATITKSATLTNPTQGVATVTIDSADTLSMNAATYFYTFRRTNAGSRAEINFGTAVLRGVYVV